MRLHVHTHIVRRAAAAVGTSVALLMSLFVFGAAPSATASEFYGAPAGATATMDGPMISAGDDWVSVSATRRNLTRFVQYGGLRVSAAYWDSALGTQSVKVRMVLQRKDGSTWTNIHSAEYNRLIAAGKPVTVPTVKAWLDFYAPRADYRAIYYVGWFGGGQKLGDGFFSATSASDYQCLPVIGLNCDVTTDGVRI